MSIVCQKRSVEAINSRKMFGFNITPEAIVGPIIMLGARWVVKNIKFTKIPLKIFIYILADFFIAMIYLNSDFNFFFLYIYIPQYSFIHHDILKVFLYILDQHH